MSGRPVQLLTAAAIAAAASLIPVSAASAGCYSGCGTSYAAPVAYYSAPVVYSYSYAAPVSYAAPCGNPCGYGYGYGYTGAPMYVVNQGPAYNAPVVGTPETTYDFGYRRSYPWYGDGGVRWHRRGWHRGYGYRGLRYGYRHSYRHHGYRYGARYSMRHPIVGPGSIHRGPRHHVMPRHRMHGMPHHGMHRMHHRMHAMPHRRMHAVPQHRMGKPGAVHPMGPRKTMP